MSLQTFALTVGTYNIRNFDYDVRSGVKTNKSALAEIIQSMKYDILSVEEIHNTKEFENFVSLKFPGYDVALSQCGGQHGQHLGFVYNTNAVELVEFSEDMSLVDPGRTGGCDVGSRPMAIALFKNKKTNQKFYGFTVHLKSGSGTDNFQKRAQQYKLIKKIITDKLSSSGVKDFYLAGDFNSTTYNFKGQDYTDIVKLVRDLGASDSAEQLKCSAYWWGGSDDGIESPSMLDHVITTPGLTSTKPKAKVGAHCAAVNCQEVSQKQLGVSYQGVSDHCPVAVEL